MNVKRYLVVKADGSVRVGIRPRCKADEVMYQLDIKIPDSWGKVAGTIPITVPEPPHVGLVQ